MGAVIHCVHGASFLRSYSCQVLLSSGVFGFSRPFLPNTLSLPVYHFLIIFLAVAVFGVEQFVIVLWLATFSLLGSYVLYWFLTSDSQSSYCGRDTLLYFFCW